MGFEYNTVFYRLNVDGLDGNASRIGAHVLSPQLIVWKQSTWAISDARRLPYNDTEIIAAKLSRSKTAPLVGLKKSIDSPQLYPNPTETNLVIPVAFFMKQHLFAIPVRPHFPTKTVLKVLTSFAGPVIGKLSFLPILREQSILERLKSYSRIDELTIRIIRSNPESRDDTKLFTEDLKKSHVQRALLRYYSDPRGLEIDEGFLKKQLDYIEDGQGSLVGGKALNAAGNPEPISGKKIAPMSLTIHSDGEPENFARQLQKNNPLNNSSPSALNSEDAKGT